MPKKIAIDWDDSELRLVAAQCSGSSVKVTDAALIPIQDGDINATLKQAIADRGLENTETLVAIGRGKAELRDLQLPEVPDDELPDMVRFQAIRSFASAGESATVDYLITKRADKQISMLAAAVGPAKLKQIQDTTTAAQLVAKRIALRPLAAAALYLSKNKITGETILIDLLSDDAEIVVARDGKVFFVRTVRMPTDPAARSTALVGELKRSLIACGSDGSPEKVILWGRESVHSGDIAKLSSATGGTVEIVDPFDLVDTSKKLKEELPDHVGRMAPLVGLLQNDDGGQHRLIDFLNPRKRIVKEPNPLRKILMVGIPVAAALLLGFFAYKNLSDLDNEIAMLQKANGDMKKPVQDAENAVTRTERLDVFLDGDVNWLQEIHRLAEKMPPSNKIIVRSINANLDQRSGGGTLNVLGGVTQSDVINDFESSLRDDDHKVIGEGLNEDERAKDAYRFTYDEDITVSPTYVRELRYDGILDAMEPATEEPGDPAEGEKNEADIEKDPKKTAETESTQSTESEQKPTAEESKEADPAPDSGPPDEVKPETNSKPESTETEAKTSDEGDQA